MGEVEGVRLSYLPSPLFFTAAAQPGRHRAFPSARSSRGLSGLPGQQHTKHRRRATQCHPAHLPVLRSAAHKTPQASNPRCSRSAFSVDNSVQHRAGFSNSGPPDSRTSLGVRRGIVTRPPSRLSTRTAWIRNGDGLLARAGLCAEVLCQTGFRSAALPTRCGPGGLRPAQPMRRKSFPLRQLPHCSPDFGAVWP